MGFFWSSDDNGRNMLKGVEDDPDNPIQLDGTLIVSILYTSPKAQEDFLRVFPSLLPEEQVRLSELLNQHPWALHLIQPDFQVADQVQRARSTMGIYTTGRAGGHNN
jgi:hypothetical protein